MARVPITAIRDHCGLTAPFVVSWLRLQPPGSGEDAMDPASQTYLVNFLIRAVALKADNYCQNAFGFPEYGYDHYQKKSAQQILALTESTSNFWYTSYDPLTDAVPTIYPPQGSGDSIYGSGDPSGSGGPTWAATITPTIPEEVILWILTVIARLYELRTNGLTSNSITGMLSETWAAIDFSPLDPFMVFRGL